MRRREGGGACEEREELWETVLVGATEEDPPSPWDDAVTSGREGPLSVSRKADDLREASCAGEVR